MGGFSTPNTHDDSSALDTQSMPISASECLRAGIDCQREREKAWRMDSGEGQEICVFVDKTRLAVTSSCLCRICHEEEEESSTDMESPCACSGTLKFAHRDCIQRWCDEKGSTVCEICLQTYEPEYTAPEKKKALVDVVVTIRESSEDPEFITASDDAASSDRAECSPGSNTSAVCCRSVAVMFTVMLLIRHFIAVITVGADQYALGILTVLLLRASGILLPFYLVMKFISAIQEPQQQYQLE